jgi:hypothetical protein
MEQIPQGPSKSCKEAPISKRQTEKDLAGPNEFGGRESMAKRIFKLFPTAFQPFANDGSRRRAGGQELVKKGSEHERMACQGEALGRFTSNRVP